MNTIKRYPALFAGLIMAVLTGGLTVADAAGVPHDLVVSIGGALAGINVAVAALVHAVVTPTSQVALTKDQDTAIKAALPPLPTSNTGV